MLLVYLDEQHSDARADRLYMIFGQDKPILESHRPPGLPLDGPLEGAHALRPHRSRTGAGCATVACTSARSAGRPDSPMRLRLYDHPLSGNAHRCAGCRTRWHCCYETVAVDFHPGREHRSERFRATVNPRGEIPVLEHDGQMLADSGAIPRHLATHHDPSRHWLPGRGRARAHRRRAGTGR